MSRHLAWATGDGKDEDTDGDDAVSGLCGLALRGAALCRAVMKRADPVALRIRSP